MLGLSDLSSRLQINYYKSFELFNIIYHIGDIIAFDYIRPPTIEQLRIGNIGIRSHSPSLNLAILNSIKLIKGCFWRDHKTNEFELIIVGITLLGPNLHWPFVYTLPELQKRLFTMTEDSSEIDPSRIIGKIPHIIWRKNIFLLFDLPI